MNNEDIIKNLFGEVIHHYSRTEALEDGVLVDLSPLATEAGFKCPVAVTSAVWAVLNPDPELKSSGQSWEGRAWDLLNSLLFCIYGAKDPSNIDFDTLFLLNGDKPPIQIKMRANCGPGDKGEPVITVMLKGED